MQIKCSYTKLVPLDDLQPHPDNENLHSEKQIKVLAKIIKKDGMRHPIIVSKLSGYICAGHGRLAALKRLEAKEAPVDFQDFEDSIQELRVRNADNQIARYAEFQRDKFELNLQKYDLDIKTITHEDFGFLDFEVLAEDKDLEKEKTEDDVPGIDLNKECKISNGMLIELGDHKLLCGDCTVKGNVELLMDTEKADMVFTDPPYGVSYEKKTSEIANQRKVPLPIMNDDLSVTDLEKIIRLAFRNIDSILADKSCYYIASPQGGELGLMMMMMMQESNLKCRHMIIWVKNAPVFSMGRLDYDYQHEPILFGWSKNRTHPKSKQQGQWKSSVWQCDREQNKVHPTMKPIALIENALLNSTDLGHICFDPFSGSGSTIIACEKTGRKGRGIEIDPHYCQVIIDRWEKYSGKQAFVINEGKRIPYSEL